MKDARSAIQSAGEGVIGQLSPSPTKEELEQLFGLAMAEASAQIEALCVGVEHDLRVAIQEANDALAEIGASPLAQEVARAEAGEIGAGHAGFGTTSARPDTFALHMLGNLGKPLEQGLNAMAQNAAGLRDVVYTVGKTAGFNFAPWGATNAGKFLAGTAGTLAKVLPFAMVALSAYMNYAEEKAKEERERQAAELRIALRKEFAEQAAIAARVMEKAVRALSDGPVQQATADLDAESARIAEKQVHDKGIKREIEALQRRCAALHQKLMG